MTIKAIAYMSGREDSAVAAALFTIFIADSQVVAPSFSPSAGTYSDAQSVSISTITSGASIYFTTDDSEPSSGAGTLYSGVITVATDTKIRAIACKSGLVDSTAGYATYKIASEEDLVAKPTLSPVGGIYTSPQSVTISTSTNGANIHYTTDGTEPTSSSGILYSGAIGISSNKTLKAIAQKSGLKDSPIAVEIYTISAISQVAAPIFSPDGGSFSSAQSVTVSTTTSGASIRYSTNGTDPTSSVGIMYSGAITVASSETVKAIAYKSGMNDSAIASASYLISATSGQVAAPTFSPAGGSYSSAQSVAISTTTSGASIRYSTDGIDPTSSTGTQYLGAVTISFSQVLKAIAYKTGWSDSEVTSVAYTITPLTTRVATPSFMPVGGTYTSVQSVSINCATVGAEIYYTLDGSIPTTSSSQYFEPIALNDDGKTKTIKALCVAPTYENSYIGSSTYTHCCPANVI